MRLLSLTHQECIPTVCTHDPAHSRCRWYRLRWYSYTSASCQVYNSLTLRTGAGYTLRGGPADK